MKQRPQFVGSVAMTTTFSQQPYVCSTVNNAPPVSRTIPHLSTPSPACYPYPNAPSRQTSCQSQSVLQVTCNMPVSPPSHISIAHSTSPGMAQASNNPVAQSTSQGMSHNTPSSTQVLAAVVGWSSNSKGTVRSPQRRSPFSQYSSCSFPKGSESPNWRERSILTQCLLDWREKNYSSFKPEQGSMTSAIQNGSSRRFSSISPSRNKTYSQCYGCREYGHHRYECPRRNISPSVLVGIHQTAHPVPDIQDQVNDCKHSIVTIYLSIFMEFLCKLIFLFIHNLMETLIIQIFPL